MKQTSQSQHQFFTKKFSLPNMLSGNREQPTNIMSAPNIGSDGWDGSAYREDEFMSASVTRCIQGTKWNNVRAICANLRGSTVGCEISDKYITGSQNLVRLIVFEDGVQWVIRLPLDVVEHRWAADTADRIENEVATYKFLRYVIQSTSDYEN